MNNDKHRIGHITGNNITCVCDPDVAYSPDNFARHVVNASLPERTVTSVKGLNDLPRGSYVQGRDGFFHAKVNSTEWLLIVDLGVEPHAPECIELPARIRYLGVRHE